MSDGQRSHREMVPLVIYLLSVLVLAIGSVIYTNVASRQTEQKFCTVVNTVVDAYKSAPQPTTPLGAKLKKEYLDLQERLGCK